jgi:hypothetical protein
MMHSRPLSLPPPPSTCVPEPQPLCHKKETSALGLGNHPRSIDLSVSDSVSEVLFPLHPSTGGALGLATAPFYRICLPPSSAIGWPAVSDSLFLHLPLDRAGQPLLVSLHHSWLSWFPGVCSVSPVRLPRQSRRGIGSLLEPLWRIPLIKGRRPRHPTW